MQATDGFYVSVSAQMKMTTRHQGVVVLPGNVGYCPSNFTGKGTTAALVGSYFLAGELARHGNEIDAALQSYYNVMTTFVREVQQPAPGLPGLFYSATPWGTWIFHFVLATLTILRINRLLYRLSPEQKGWKLPDYQELGVQA